MNARIKELAKLNGYGEERWNSTEQFEEFICKFGESIVNECISIVQNLSPGYIDYRAQIEDGFREDCVYVIRERLGVKQ